MGEHKEKLEWLGNAANHRGDDGGSKDDPEAGAALGFCGGVERSCDGRKAKELDPAGGGKTGPRRKLIKGARAMGEDGEQAAPRGVDAVVNDQVVVVDRHVEQVVQPHGLERSLQKHKDAHAKGADARKCMAQRFGHCVYGGHDGGRDSGKGKHGKKADEVDQRGAREGAEPIGNLGIVEAVMDGDDGCRYRQRADNAGVERLDAVDDGDAASGGQRRRVLKSKIVSAQLNDLAQKEAVGKIGHECLEAATCRLFLGKADGQRYSKKERKALKDRPRAALDDGPKNVPRGSVYGEIADDVRSRCESGDADHEA